MLDSFPSSKLPLFLTIMYIIFILLSVFANEVFTFKFNLLEQDYYNTDDMDHLEDIFNQFLDKYDKHYEGDEYEYRLNILKERLKDLNEWNKGEAGRYGLNEFSDLTHEEFSQGYLGLLGNAKGLAITVYEPKGGAPEHLDWRKFGYVTSVKQQSNYLPCGSCYAFSAVAHIESLYAKRHNTTAIHLSEQQALDCDNVDRGCDGGLPYNVFTTLAKQGGLMLAKDYPYLSFKGECMTVESEIAVTVHGGRILTFENEEDLKDALAYYGPLSIPMHLTTKMSTLQIGKITEFDECMPEDEPNHAVLLVGYGRDNNEDYWIIKNSWGTHWGDRGYMRLIRGRGACGIGRMAFVADID